MILTCLRLCYCHEGINISPSFLQTTPLELSYKQLFHRGYKDTVWLKPLTFQVNYILGCLGSVVTFQAKALKPIWIQALNQEPILELHSRAAPNVEAHHLVNSPDTGRNSRERRTIKKIKILRFQHIGTRLVRNWSSVAGIYRYPCKVHLILSPAFHNQLLTLK